MTEPKPSRPLKGIFTDHETADFRCQRLALLADMAEWAAQKVMGRSARVGLPADAITVNDLHRCHARSWSTTRLG